MTDTVYLQVPGGQAHEATRINGSLRVDENCNLDDAKDEYVITADEFALLERSAICAHCVPDLGASEPDVA